MLLGNSLFFAHSSLYVYTMGELNRSLLRSCVYGRFHRHWCPLLFVALSDTHVTAGVSKNQAETGNAEMWKNEGALHTPNTIAPPDGRSMKWPNCDNNIHTISYSAVIFAKSSVVFTSRKCIGRGRNRRMGESLRKFQQLEAFLQSKELDSSATYGLLGSIH